DLEEFERVDRQLVGERGLWDQILWRHPEAVGDETADARLDGGGREAHAAEGARRVPFPGAVVMVPGGRVAAALPTRRPPGCPGGGQNGGRAGLSETWARASGDRDRSVCRWPACASRSAAGTDGGGEGPARDEHADRRASARAPGEDRRDPARATRRCCRSYRATRPARSRAIPRLPGRASFRAVPCR